MHHIFDKDAARKKFQGGESKILRKGTLRSEKLAKRLTFRLKIIESTIDKNAPQARKI